MAKLCGMTSCSPLHFGPADILAAFSLGDAEFASASSVPDRGLAATLSHALWGRMTPVATAGLTALLFPVLTGRRRTARGHLPASPMTCCAGGPRHDNRLREPRAEAVHTAHPRLLSHFASMPGLQEKQPLRS